MDSQDGRKLMEYIAFIAESLQHEISNMKGRHGSGLGQGGMWGELLMIACQPMCFWLEVASPHCKRA